MKKHELDEQSINALVDYRLERSLNALSEAEVLFMNNFYNAAINRLYYACYYAVSALLIKNRIPAQSHKGVKQLFGLHFIKKDKILPKQAAFTIKCSILERQVIMMILFSLIKILSIKYFRKL